MQRPVPRRRVLGRRPLVALAALLAALPACKRTPPNTQPRLVVLYMTCTLNKQYTAPYNPAVPYTPALAAFAARGTVFERHQTESGQSGIAFASIVSGGQADHHGVFKHPRKLDPDLVLVDEAFAEAGYAVETWLAHRMATADLAYAQAVAREAVHEEPLTGDAPAFRALLERLRTDPSARAFVMTNFTVTHAPYQGADVDRFCDEYPAECAGVVDRADLAWARTMHAERHRELAFDLPNARRELGLDDAKLARLVAALEVLYKADVHRLDEMFGGVIRAIEEAGLLDDAMIAFTADHGETLYRDNALFHWTHGYQLAAEVITVPWILVAPQAGVPASRYAGVTRSIDVFPTLAGLAGAGVPAFDGAGVNLAPVLRGDTQSPELTAYSHTSLIYAPLRARRLALRASLFPSPLPDYMWVAARRGDLYARRTRDARDVWTTQMFDLAADPEQRRNGFDPQRALHTEIEAGLLAYRERMIDAAYAVHGTGAGVPRKQVMERLRSLGYVE